MMMRLGLRYLRYILMQRTWRLRAEELIRCLNLSVGAIMHDSVATNLIGTRSRHHYKRTDKDISTRINGNVGVGGGLTGESKEIHPVEILHSNRLDISIGT